MFTAVFLVLWLARHSLLPFIIGGVAAYALTPLVDRLSRLIPARSPTGDVIRRGIAIAVIYLVAFGAVTEVGVVLIPIAIGQIGQFVSELPGIIANAQTQVAGWLEEYQRRTPPEVQARVTAIIESGAGTIARTAVSGAQGSVGALTETVGVLFGFAIVPFWMFYVLRDRYFISRNVMRGVPEGGRADVSNVARIADHLLGRYIRGQLMLGLVVGVSVGIVMTLLGVQLSVGLGLWAGLTELIPIIGPWIGAIPGLVIVGTTNPGLFWAVALTYFVVQMLENNLLVPRIQGQAVDLHPAVIIMLLAVAGAVWGFAGLVAVIPLTAILRELFWYADRRLRGRTPEQSLAASHAGGRQEDLPLDARIDNETGVEDARA